MIKNINHDIDFREETLLIALILEDNLNQTLVRKTFKKATSKNIGISTLIRLNPDSSLFRVHFYVKHIRYPPVSA